MIPSKLGKLKNLWFFYLSHNNFIGEVPSELGYLITSLVSINISFNCLTSSLLITKVKNSYANRESFHGNASMCLEYNNDVCTNKVSTRKAKLSFGLIVAVALGGAVALIVIVVVIIWWCSLAPQVQILYEKWMI